LTLFPRKIFQQGENFPKAKMPHWPLLPTATAESAPMLNTHMAVSVAPGLISDLPKVLNETCVERYHTATLWGGVVS